MTARPESLNALALGVAVLLGIVLGAAQIVGML